MLPGCPATTADRYGIPLFVLDVPFQRGPQPEEYAVDYVAAQLEEFIAWAEAHTGRKLKPQRFWQVLLRSAEAIRLWQEVLDLGGHRPLPLNVPDMFAGLAPIVALRSTRQAVDLYQRLKAELESRIAEGVAAVPGERYRLLWTTSPASPSPSLLSSRPT